MVIGPAPAKDEKDLAAAETERIIERFLDVVRRCAVPAGGRPAEEMLAAARLVAGRLRQREGEVAQLLRITEHVNYGVSLDETLGFVYREMHTVIPYNRIGFSLIDENRRTVSARWAQSDREMRLTGGYEAPLEGSTLSDILRTARPRIINDLEDYLRKKPSSESTRLIVEEGMRSSLTCPLIVQGKPVGFMFFSSVERDTYSDVHVEFFQQIAGQLSAIVEKGRLYSELAGQKAVIERQNEVMTRDLEMARQVQRALIPKEPPRVPALDVAFRYEPAIQVGGDILDIVTTDGGPVVFFVGDVMGHGAHAALVASLMKAALQTAVETDMRPASVLAGLNHTLTGLFDFSFVTAACCTFDPDAKTAAIALAGHAPPLWLHAATGELSRPGEASLPLGVSRSTSYEAEEIRPAPGDLLMFYTDGVVEARNPAGAEYSVDRLARQVQTLASAGVERLLDEVRGDLARHSAGREAADDLTLLVLKRSS